MGATPTPHAQPEGESPVSLVRQETVVIWATNIERRAEIVDLITSARWLPLVAESEAHAVRLLADAPPDLFILAVDDTSADELAVIDQVRSGPDGEHVPIVCLLDRQRRSLTLEAFGRRADDVVSGHPHPSELIARFRTRIERPPVPRAKLVEDPVTGALTPEAFAEQLAKEEERVRRGGSPGALAFISLDELPELTARLGSRARDELLAQVVRLIKADGRKLDFIGSRRGMLAILLPDTPTKGAQARFDRLVKKIYEREFLLDGAAVRLTPVIGYTASVEKTPVEQFEDRAWDALMYQADQLDLHPTKWVAAMSEPATSSTRLARAFDRYRTLFQVIVQQAAALVLPFLVYWLLDSLGADITGVTYLLLVVSLGVTATVIWGESHTALAPTVPPPAPDGPPPRASAIIAAYLPNEAGTIVETVEAFLEQDYPDLEVILAYNTPNRLDVEGQLRAIATRDPRFVPLRVEGSVSKAQNVNAAMARVTGEFVGLFDADHHPEPGSFHRAWCWIASGVGVVQGHCVIRNGDTNFVTRLVATEFEAIYAVSHPGRARLHGFGIFGGSNGYWRASLLHRTRMRGSMLTEDIDSSMRVVQSGEMIISDPELVSTELAPETAGALWNQRLRWAQGWSQVSLRHLIQMIRKAPTVRQRIGVAYLLGWREIYPWVSLQMFPLLAYWWFQGEPAIRWFVPIFVFTSLLTFSAGPIQTWYAWRLAHPSIKRHRRWFIAFVLASLFFYIEAKNVVARTAHVKELMQERKWKVTPRTGAVALDATSAHVDITTPRSDGRPGDDVAPTRPHGPPAVTRVPAGAAEPATTVPPPEPPTPRRDAPRAARRSVAPRRRGRSAATPRTRRHRTERRTTHPPTAPQPAIYDQSVETTASGIYDHQRETVEAPPRVDGPADGPATRDEFDAPTRPTPPPRIYEPDFLRQLVHRDHDVDLDAPWRPDSAESRLDELLNRT